MTTIPELADDLTDRQNALLGELARLRGVRDDASDAFAKQVKKCQGSGISYGIMGWKLGLPKEAVYRAYKRWRDRTAS